VVAKGGEERCHLLPLFAPLFGVILSLSQALAQAVAKGWGEGEETTLLRLACKWRGEGGNSK